MLPVQLNVTNFAAQKQTLQSIAEQTVSITRTKIQELKAENPDRRLILVGMSSASALAIQVALVEQVSGVVCFGFSYNTVHGVRGQADDHFLELSTPTLFLVGQNASRCSEEEIEYFREKLTAPTSTVIVGAADDYLRVSKTKRRLEGVTQEMVDNMVVDEIADFATKCLQRPLPPRIKTTVMSVPRREIDSLVGQVRKRKIEDLDIPKGMTIKAQRLMRPTSTSDDVLEIAVQSILPDHEERVQIPQIKTTKFVPTNRMVQGNIGPQKMRVMNTQFAQSKAQQVNQTTKFITIGGQKTSKVPQLQSRPVRSLTPTQQYSRGKIPVVQQQSFSPTKYTIVRHSNGVAYLNEPSTDISRTNILDMPIVFADNEGNIDEEASTMSDGSVISIASDSPPQVSKHVTLKTSTVNSLVPTTSTPSYTITKNKNILIQKPTTGKMFMLNGRVIGKQVSADNIVLPKPATSLAQQIRVQKFGPSSKFIKQTPTTGSGKKIEILNTTIIKQASVAPRTTTNFVSLADGKRFPGTRLSLPVASTSLNKNQIVIKSNSLKPYTGAQILPSSISGNKQLGNLTVKRLNVVPSATITKVFKES